MIASAALAKRALSMFGRVFPRCSMIAQAVAFNLFLAFSPTLLIAVGLATSPIGLRTNLFDLISDLTSFLPPGSQQIVSEVLVRRGPDAWKWALLGLGGTLLAGTQVMRLLMEGIHTIYGDRERPGFLARQLRALALLILTIAPLLMAAILGVFGKPLRRLVGGGPGVWILCAQDAVWNHLRRTGSGHRLADLDGAFHGDYFFGRGVECGAGREPQRRAGQWVSEPCAWSATPGTRATSAR